MNGHQDIVDLIGQRVRSGRAARQWTLDDLAARSGISRRTLVAIEQGQANPSVAVLSAISDALGVAFASLVDSGHAEPLQVRRAGEGAILWEGPAGGIARLAGSVPGQNVAELWEFRLEPGEEHASPPHPAGTRELVLVHSGELTLTVPDGDVVLAPGDSAAHAGDSPHRYANASGAAVVFGVVVHYPAPAAER